jgi:hypothetical protein
MMEKNRGYWSVDNQYYTNKVRAILAAQQSNLGYGAISFHYNDEWWNQVDWNIEPDESLQELYIQRAQQLREKYETLILRFSGGADSLSGKDVTRVHTRNGNAVPKACLEGYRCGLRVQCYVQPGEQPIESDALKTGRCPVLRGIV